MESELLREEVWAILNPEPDEDFHGFLPHDRLANVHKIDCSYWSPREWVSQSIWNRLVGDPKDPIHDSIESLTVPNSLWWAALRLFGDSLIAYSDDKDESQKDGWAVFRFFPSVLMTFWASFEAFVRLQSEFLLAMSSVLPEPIRQAFTEIEVTVDNRGQIIQRSRRRPVLERYALLLEYGYSLKVDRGATFWQNAVAANKARDMLVHFEISGSPSITCRDLWAHLEAITLLWIVPSALCERTIYYQQYDCYHMIAELHPYLVDFEERPFHKGWPRSGGVVIHCPMDNLDDEKYPRAGQFDPAEWSLRRLNQTSSGQQEPGL